MKCELCGKENKENALFCAECGKALKDAPIDLDLIQLNVPAAARKAHIVKVSAKQPAAEQPKAPAAEQKPEATAEKAEKAQAQTPEEQTPETTAEESAPAQEGELIDLSPAPKQPEPAAKDPREEPMRIGNWIATFLLSMIPVAGTVLIFVWAFSSKTNKSKKSYAQAALIFSAALLVLTIAAYFLFARLLGNGAGNIWNQFFVK